MAKTLAKWLDLDPAQFEMVEGQPLKIKESILGGNTALESDVTVTVGSGGDFATINAAIESLSKNYYPVYKQPGKTATINLLAGFVVAEQIIASNGCDLSWITITGDDAETVISREALTISADGYDANIRYSAFIALNNSRLPTIGQLFDMDTSGAAGMQDGMILHHNSSGIVLVGCGVKNAASIGILIIGGSTVFASGSIFTGAGSNGAFVSRGASLVAEDADFSNAGKTGVVVSNSAKFSAPNSTINNCGVDGLYIANGSTASLIGATCTGNTRRGIYAVSSCVDASGITATGNNEGIFAIYNSTVNVSDSDISYCYTGVYALFGSIICAMRTVAKGCDNCGFFANGTSMIHARETNGSVVGSVLSYRVFDGSTIDTSSIYNTLGNVNYSQAFNVITSGGIIYQ